MEKEFEDLNIKLSIHCTLCIEERPPTISPRDWQRNETGWTEKGFQVWCKRHDVNVLHVDFEGQTHPASTNRLKRKTKA